MDKKVIFVSVPRTGSKAIQKALGDESNNHLARWKIQQGGFSFGFCRHPFDRLVSWYTYHRNIIDTWELYPMTFKEWVKKGCQTHWSEELCNISGVTTPINQHEFLEHVGFIGRFENLQADFNEVMRRLEKEPVHLARWQNSSHDDWVHYFDNYTRKQAMKICEKDFETFNYSI